MQQTLTSSPATKKPQVPPMQLRQGIAFGAIILTATFVLFLAPHETAFASATAVILLCIALWTTAWIPGWLTGMIFFVLCMAGHVAPARDVFAGFASSATWLMLSGLVIGASIQFTGLGDRLASQLAPRIGSSFSRAVLILTFSGMALAFAMPSAMGRILLLLPILQALAEHLGYQEHSKGYRGIILSGVFGTFLPAFTILPANIPNNVFAGSQETILGLTPTYGTYLLLNFPVLGFLKVLFVIAILLIFFREKPSRAISTHTADADRLTLQEMHLSVLLLIAIGLWATDSLHGVAPAWIGLTVATWCLYPGSGLLGKNPFSTIKLEALIYVAAIVSLGSIANHSGLGSWLANQTLSVLPLDPNAPGHSFGILSGLSTLVGLFVTLPGIPPVLTPLAPSLADATQWSPMTVAMTQVVGFSTVILPYQSPPLIMAMQSGGLSTKDVTRICVIVAGLTILVLWPLDYVWWTFLGVFTS